jgi:hypothetical protein
MSKAAHSPGKVSAEPSPEKAVAVELDLDNQVWRAKTQLQFEDANGLALCAFGFSTFMFAMHNYDVLDVATNKGVYQLIDMLTWAFPLCVLTSGIIQGLSGDKLGFTSYVFHSAILGAIGHNFDKLLNKDYSAPAGSLIVVGFFSLFATWINIVFTAMAFRVAYMFGILYSTVALMFFALALNLLGAFGTDKTGGYIVGTSCMLVSVQCAYLLIPVMTGRGFLK